MKQNLTPQPTRHDDTVLRNALLKLTATQKITCTVVIAVVALVWYDLLNRVMDFGHGIDYAGLHAFGPQAVEILQQYNPFFWWAVVALCTLIIAYFLYRFIRSSQEKVQSKLVSAEMFGEIVNQLSEPAREVLRWAWLDRRNPVSVGDLQRTAHELRARRAAKISLAREHAQALDTQPTADTQAKNLQSS